jgi:hypothetical protein
MLGMSVSRSIAAIDRSAPSTDGFVYRRIGQSTALATVAKYSTTPASSVGNADWRITIRPSTPMSS